MSTAADAKGWMERVCVPNTVGYRVMLKGFFLIFSISVQIALVVWVVKLHLLVVMLGGVVKDLTELVMQLTAAL